MSKRLQNALKNLKKDFPQYSFISPYLGSKKLIKIKCNKCSFTFERKPAILKEYPVCSNCVRLEKFKDFRQRGNAIHSHFYEYFKEDFVNLSSKTKIRCPKHGEFIQNVSDHLQGKGCLQCGIEKTTVKNSLTVEEFETKGDEVHEGKYIYHGDYLNARTRVKITCPDHGDFEQTAGDHLQGKGCPLCANEKKGNYKKLSDKDFKDRSNEIHNGKYKYIEKYKGSKTKIIMECPEHGSFYQRPNDHLMGHGCPNCVKDGSSEVYEFLTDKNIDIVQKDRKILDGLELDILIPSLKIGIEYNGLYYHREGLQDGIGGVGKTYHLNKTKLANNKGYGLIHIFENEWANNQELLKNKLLHIINQSNGKRIGARQTVIKEISAKESNSFLEQYHIQGRDTAGIRIGAYHNQCLVGVMTFVKKRGENNKYKLNRFATNYDYIVAGLASKLLKYFERNYNPQYIETFADRRWTLNKNTNLYTKLGFSFVHKTKPNYYYFIPGYLELYSRMKFQKHKLLKENKEWGNLTETEIMTIKGYDRIWDCGNFKYEKNYV